MINNWMQLDDIFLNLFYVIELELIKENYLRF